MRRGGYHEGRIAEDGMRYRHICVGGQGHIAGAPTPNPPQTRCSPRGALGSAGAGAPC